ncbi:MAG: response regulator [Cyanobacteria bacterium SZAS LIN-2]|nr:response regulator [Cyanobacteria bacterium SZAS LIN-3]MBS1994930.1 response regulator [Cyanobacteria bacterium SZAS LIN-2]MBS2009812.1 response regulator [Cyanobacteria bacterium SZAS TMP-1]
MSDKELLILVIEDEQPIRRFLKMALTDHGYGYREAESGKDGLRKVASERPDLVILDLGLPDMDGLDVTRQLREWSSVPVIVLSARGQEKDKVEALDAGADDYLTKPFGVPELLARIRVGLRHAARAATGQVESDFSFGGVRVDMAKRQVLRDGVEVHLTRIEYKLLVTLIKYAGKVVTQNQLLKEIWGQEYSEESNYLRVYMAHLRRKLEVDSAHPRHLITEAGVGYRLKAE